MPRLWGAGSCMGVKSSTQQIWVKTNVHQTPGTTEWIF
jgi:hypothetical protein